MLFCMMYKNVILTHPILMMFFTNMYQQTWEGTIEKPVYLYLHQNFNTYLQAKGPRNGIGKIPTKANSDLKQ